MNVIRKTIENDEDYLRQVSKEVFFEDKKLKDELKAIKDYCNETECFALAAVQIGIPKRIICLKNTSLDVSIEDKEHNESKIMINPTIICRKGETEYWEACLSCLDFMGLVKRPYEMTVHYYDETGEEHEETFIDFPCTVISHEIDHLDGILHMDVAEKVLNMPKEERKEFRKTHPYKIISKKSEYDRIKEKIIK